MSREVRHSMATPEHGTPPEYIELARYALGCTQLDCDPASSDYWNHHLVGARTFYDVRTNGLRQRWFGRLFVNPPGGKDEQNRSLVNLFWDRLVESWRTGAVHSAVWMGYSLEQLTQLQARPAHPLQFVTAIPSGRIGFMVRQPGAPPMRSTQPTHGNYVTLLQTVTDSREAKVQMQRFVERAKSIELGCAVVRPM